MVADLGAPAAGPGGRAAGAAPAPAAGGLVRLETSDTNTRPAFEEQRIRDAERRALRVFKSVSCAGDLHRLSKDPEGRRLRGWFLTMTYRPGVDWAPRQISGLMKCIRTWASRQGASVRFVWVAEQHKSGRIHYHAIVFLPRRLSMPFPDRRGWWPHGMTNRQELRKESVGYLIKYATKQQTLSAPWPKGCRLSGHGGLDFVQRVRRAWWVLPRYVREVTEDWQRIRRARGGGWVSQVTGQWWPAWSGPLASPVGAGV